MATKSSNGKGIAKPLPQHFLGLRYNRRNLTVWATRNAVAHIWPDRVAVPTTETVALKGQTATVAVPVVHVYAATVAFVGTDPPACVTVPVLALANGLTKLDFWGKGKAQTATLHTGNGGTFVLATGTGYNVPENAATFAAWYNAHVAATKARGLPHVLDDRRTTGKRVSKYAPPTLPVTATK